MEQIEFLKGMKKLSIAYFKDIKEEELSMWYDVFKNQNADVFYKAINDVILKSKFFPSIAELKERCEEQKQDEYFKKIQLMKMENKLSERDYQKLLMWLSEGIIPHWLKDDEKKLISNEG